LPKKKEIRGNKECIVNKHLLSNLKFVSIKVDIYIYTNKANQKKNLTKLIALKHMQVYCVQRSFLFTAIYQKGVLSVT